MQVVKPGEPPGSPSIAASMLRLMKLDVAEARGASRLPLHCGIADHDRATWHAHWPGEPPGSPSIAAGDARDGRLRHPNARGASRLPLHCGRRPAIVRA